MAGRGFFALLAREAKKAVREQERAERAAVQEHRVSTRRAEQAQRSADRSLAQLNRAVAAAHKRLEKEAREEHIAAMVAMAEEQTMALTEHLAEIDSLLASTLTKDDYIELESLRVSVSHPSFDPGELARPLLPPLPRPDPPRPAFVMPEAPTGLASLFGKRKHTAAVEEARTAFGRAMLEWKETTETLPAIRQAAADDHARKEAARVAALSVAQAQYAQSCREREDAAAERNRAVDELRAHLAYGDPDAVQEYVAMVLAQSDYPSHFEVASDFSFDPATAELRLRVVVPCPDILPNVKSYKYSKSDDTITSSPLPQKACRDRYASAVHQVALRSLHEVFEADRRGIIKTIALEVGVETTDPATGRHASIPFVGVGVERATFLTINLSAVVPLATLQRLGAVVSKNPFGLVPVDPSGVRRG